MRGQAGGELSGTEVCTLLWHSAVETAAGAVLSSSNTAVHQVQLLLTPRHGPLQPLLAAEAEAGGGHVVGETAGRHVRSVILTVLWGQAHHLPGAEDLQLVPRDQGRAGGELAGVETCRQSARPYP